MTQAVLNLTLETKMFDVRPPARVAATQTFE